MLSLFQQHLQTQFPFLVQAKLLVACSGGLDSVVLLQLCKSANLAVAVAHCNFQLRGLESIQDQQFVQELCANLNLPFHTTHFDTKAYAQAAKCSTQMAARDLRYDWFAELAQEFQYDYILTAHHADDALETFLINLSRGTGLDGLVGIPSVNEYIVRPLLQFSREQLYAYALEQGYAWREDSSNASDVYLRNAIRHHIVPQLKTIQPTILQAFLNTQSHLQNSQSLVQDALDLAYEYVVTELPDRLQIDLDKLLKYENYNAYMYGWLNDYGFSAWEDVYKLVYAQSGKKVLSSNFTLLKDRTTLLLYANESERGEDVYSISEKTTEITTPICLQFSKQSTAKNNSKSVIFVDADLLQFPLVLRRWKTADVIYPAGMKGQSKKLSKFFKDEKWAQIDKENVWLLYSNDQIVWVVGHRQDERFVPTHQTKNKIQISYIP
ncbi:MAG: tRNA lysidine(34) synthetase TilS [Flavobacterium sp.]|nr:tRNA lysidine(34) synthetase TilS [Flavobacterium sp.]